MSYRSYQNQKLWRKTTALSTLIAIAVSSSAAFAEDSTSTPTTGQKDKVTSTQAAPERDSLAAKIKAKINADSQVPASTPAAQTSITDASKKGNAFTRNFGMNYNSFFAGPALTNMSEGLPPSLLGGPDDTGMYFWNLVSIKKKNFIGDLALDVQLRGQLLVNNDNTNEDGSKQSPLYYRHQGQRVGLSGKFLKGKDYVLAGAVNTDLPIPGLQGQVNTERKLIVNPGMFATFSYDPTGSKWGLFALLSPRYYLYSDSSALTAQDRNWQNGNSSRNALASRKLQMLLAVSPSVSYTFNEKTQARLGVQLEYDKMIKSEGLIRQPMAIELGLGYDLTSWMNVYTYVTSSTPLDNALREKQGSGDVKWFETASLNIWFSGTVF